MTRLLESLTGCTLLHPALLLLALLVPLAFLLRRLRRPPGLLLAPAALLGPAGDGAPPLPASWRVRLLPLPGILEGAGLALVALAAARPVERVPLPVRTEGIDVLLCLDVSSSMTARDLDGRRTRLEVAREAAAAFVRGRPADRIGLLCFARYPDVRCPPTLDHAALGEILRAVAPVDGDGPEDATGIGAAAARAAQALRGSGGGSRVAVLLTDGEENVSTTGTPGAISPEHAGQLCEALGVRVYAVVAGAGGPGGGARPAVDDRPVRRLAARTGGRFFEAGDAGALAAVYARIDALEKSAFERERFAVEERFHGFALAALALLLLGRGLRRTVLGTLP